MKTLTPSNHALNSPCSALARVGQILQRKGHWFAAQEVAQCLCEAGLRASSRPAWLLMKPRTMCALTGL